MKNRARMLGLICGLVLSTASYASQVFVYRYTFHTGDVVSGSFTGAASGNLITYLADITVNLNGIPLNGTGPLYGASITSGDWGTWLDWVDGGAVLSFDGLQNNFGFSDVHNPGDPNFRNVFVSVTGVPSIPDQVQILRSDPFLYPYDISQGPNQPFVPSLWSVAMTAVPEPNTNALFLTGLALLLALKRKDQSHE